MKKAKNYFVLFYLSVISSVGQVTFQFEQVTPSSGLSSNRVFMTIEDALGFIWIATDRGIDRFDGNQIKNYSLDRIEEIRRLNFVELFLAIDAKGKIWALSNGGILQYFDEDQDAFVYYDQLGSGESGSLYVSTFYIDHEDRFLIGTFNGVTAYHIGDKRSEALAVVSGTVASITQDTRHTYYIGSREGIFLFDEHLNFIKNLRSETSEEWPVSRRIDALYLQESEDRLWIGTSENGLYYWNLRHSDLEKAPNQLGEVNVPIRSITPIDGGKLLIGSDGAGVFQLDAVEMKVNASYILDADDPNSISSNSIYHIFENSQGVIFISSYRGGLNVVNPFKQNFRLLSHQPGQANSLQNNVILSILESANGVISFGTDQGISQWTKSTNQWRHFKVSRKAEDLRSPVVLAQDIDQNGTHWAASFNYSLSQKPATEDRFQVADMRDKSLSELRIKSLLAHSGGKLLFGSTSNGLWAVSEEGIRQYNIREPLVLAEYSPTKALIGNRNGLSMLDLTYDEVRPIDEAFLDDTLTNKVVVTLLIDNQQRVWAGTTDNGIFRIDFVKNEVAHFTTANGLPTNAIFSIIQDNDGQVWAATGYGISRIKGNEIENFYKSDGVPEIDFNRNAGQLDAEGLIYFGTNQGAIYFDPKEINYSKADKKLILTEFFLNHKRMNVSKDSPLSGTLNRTEKISLRHSQNSFEIAFTSVDFVKTGQAGYRWKLDGFDADWITTSNSQRASYTNLDAGQYIFRLQMVDPTGRQLAQERDIRIVIKPPFWQTTPAYFIYVILGLAFLTGVIYFNKLRLESRHAENQLHLLMEMAHEIKTPLTLIKAPLTDIISNNKVDEPIKESLGVALSSADKLHKQMMQFLDFRRIGARKESLNLQTLDLIELLNEKMYAFKVLADRKAIDVQLETPLDKFFIQNDLKILDKIISNLLSNAIKYTMNRGQVKLILTTTERSWELAVKDTGIGIPKSDQKKIFKLFYRTDAARNSGSTGSGVGLILAKDLAKTLGGDLILASSTPKGSIFKVFMPLLESTYSQATLSTPLNEEVPSEEAASDNTKLKILLVEDDPDLRQYEKSRLSVDFSVSTASNGHEALEYMKSALPDLVISDIGMPKMNGRQLCMNIKENPRTSHIPVILLTGMSEKEHVIQGLESGADDYIVKPFDFDLLVTKVENLLSTRKALKEKFINQSDEIVEWEAISNELDQEFIQEATRLVEENLSDAELSVNFLCEAMAMSRTTFYHKLKSLIDMSPADFIRTIRLKEAKKLLHNPSYNISEVAYGTGFMDAKYFATVFKKYYGQSPSSYVAEISHKSTKS